MAHPRVRQASPPRILLDPARSSTGTVLSSSYDSRFTQPPRSSVSTISSARDSVFAARNSIQPVSKRTYVDQSHPGAKISSTTYAVRPRRDSDTSMTRRPPTIVTKSTSPTRDRPDFVDSPRDLVTYKPTLREEPTKYLQPAPRVSVSGGHQRHNSATRAELDRYSLSGQLNQPPKEYHRRGPYVEKVYSSARPTSVRYSDDEGYSYTTPKEQFARDFANRPPRENSSRRERPNSAVETEFKQLPFRRDTAPPPASSRHFSRIDTADGRTSRTGLENDTDRPREIPRPRPANRAAVVHQRDDGYSSSRDDYESHRPSVTRDIRQDEQAALIVRDRRNSDREYDRRPERIYHREHDRERPRPNEKDRDRERDRGRAVDNQKDKNYDWYAEKPRERERERDRERDRERERDRDPNQDRSRDLDRLTRDNDGRRKPRSRDPSPESSSMKGLATAAGIGGLAAAGLRKVAGKDAESDDEHRRHRRHHRRRSRDQRDIEQDDGRHYDNLESRDQDRYHHRRPTAESSGSDTPDDDHPRRRPASRTRERRGTREVDEQRGADQIEPIENENDEQNPTLATGTMEDLTGPSTESGPDQSQRASPTTNEGRTLSPGEGEDNRPRRVQLVEPIRDKRDDAKPKGILKPPREIPFPEDPNPQREGVAPLKSAGQGGIPPNARWTKISRVLVNPEALERAQERFEEREDYVIVLRVLKREEIEKFAEKTREIRETRERAWQEQLEERRRRKAERQARDEHFTDEDDFEDNRPQLALEAPPAHPPADLRNLQTQNNSEPRMESALPTPTMNFDNSNYSMNV